VSAQSPVLELRVKRTWFALGAVAVPAFAAVIVLATVDTLAKAPYPLPALLTIGFLVVVLGGLIVVPGTALVSRAARGIPNVRLDERGAVWGSDRSRDLSIDWSDVEAVVSKTSDHGQMTDRVFVLRPKPTHVGPKASSLYGRAMGGLSRAMYGSPYTISTAAEDHSWEDVRRFLGARLPPEVFERG
jgi:hypothetical protein